MAAAERNLIILGELPMFKGNPLQKEKHNFKPGCNVRTFLRYLDNYFLQHGIVDNASKLRVLYSRIHPESGDAGLLMAMYTDSHDLEYDQVQRELLCAYPNPELAEVQFTSRKLKALDISDPGFVIALSRLEGLTKVYVETLLTSDVANNLNLNMDTRIPSTRDGGPPEPPPAAPQAPAPGAPPPGAPGVPPAPPAPPAPPVQQRAQPDGNPQNGGGNPPPAGNNDAPANVGAGGAVPRRQQQPEQNGLLVKRLLQNVLIKFLMETQLEEKAYKKIANIPLNVTSTHLVTRTVQVLERENMKKVRSTRRVVDPPVPEVLYQLNTNQQKPGNGYRRERAEGSRKCYSCDNEGHIAANCPMKKETRRFCKYCKKPNHTEKHCLIRIRRKVPYCEGCARIGHALRDCRKSKQNQQKDDRSEENHQKGRNGIRPAARVRNIVETNYGEPDLQETDSSEDSE